MDDPLSLTLVLACFLGLLLGFGTVFVLIVRYLYSIHLLAQDLRDHDRELWVSLGSPDLFGFVSDRPLRALTSPLALFSFFIRGGPGATSDRVRERVAVTKGRFRFALIALVTYFVASSVIMGLLVSFASQS